MFGNWLNGIDKSTKAKIHIGVCALYGIVGMMLFLTELEMLTFYTLSI
jgi:hypothetical protein